MTYLGIDRNTGKRLYSIKELASTNGKPGLLPVSPVTIWRWVKAGTFPKPIKLGERITRWDIEEVEKFIREKFNHERA